MLKVNEFENGVGLSDNNKLFPFSVESNIHYRVNSLDDLINNSYPDYKPLHHKSDTTLRSFGRLF